MFLLNSTHIGRPTTLHDNRSTSNRQPASATRTYCGYSTSLEIATLARRPSNATCPICKQWHQARINRMKGR